MRQYSSAFSAHSQRVLSLFGGARAIKLTIEEIHLTTTAFQAMVSASAASKKSREISDNYVFNVFYPAPV